MIHVVTGHVCSGKSTYVRNHAKPGDIVIDMDRIALALSVEGTPHHDYPRHVVDVVRAARLEAMDAAQQEAAQMQQLLAAAPVAGQAAERFARAEQIAASAPRRAVPGT